MQSQRSTRPHQRPAPPQPGAKVLPTPLIRPLSPAASVALLRRQVVGRMAHSFHDRVDITPIHYVYSAGWLFARTTHGAKMDIVAHSPWVAFEVDEIEGVFDWRSVVVHGTAYTMQPDAGPTEARLWHKGMDLLRRIVPATGTDDDPVAFRDVVFGIHVDAMTGRCATTTEPGRPRRKAPPA